jgi:hypothetical protein
MPIYRVGGPGEDIIAHLRMTRPSRPCACPKFEDDKGSLNCCARMGVALCDGPGCDKPICELHRTKHATKPDTDFCPDHKNMAEAVDRST